MIDGAAVIPARAAGEIRYCVTASASLDRAYAQFGLLGCAGALTEYTRGQALALLTQLLWKDMAYGCEAAAQELARQIFIQHECPTSKYFSNGAWHEGNPGRCGPARILLLMAA